MIVNCIEFRWRNYINVSAEAWDDQPFSISITYNIIRNIYYYFIIWHRIFISNYAFPSNKQVILAQREVILFIADIFVIFIETTEWNPLSIISLVGWLVYWSLQFVQCKMHCTTWSLSLFITFIRTTLFEGHHHWWHIILQHSHMMQLNILYTNWRTFFSSISRRRLIQA